MARQLLATPSSAGGPPISPLMEEGRAQDWYEIVEIAFRVATLAFVLLGIIFESPLFLTIASVLGLISFLFYLQSQYGPDDNWVGWVLNSVCPRRVAYPLASGNHPGGSGVLRTVSTPAPPLASQINLSTISRRSQSAPSGLMEHGFVHSPNPPLDTLEELSSPPVSGDSGGSRPGSEDS